MRKRMRRFWRARGGCSIDLSKGTARARSVSWQPPRQTHAHGLPPVLTQCISCLTPSCSNPLRWPPTPSSSTSSSTRSVMERTGEIFEIWTLILGKVRGWRDAVCDYDVCLGLRDGSCGFVFKWKCWLFFLYFTYFSICLDTSLN